MLNQTKLQRRVEGKDLESVADRVALAHAKLLPARGVRWHANPPRVEKCAPKVCRA